MVGGVIALLIAGYLSLWPVPIEPVAWKAPAAPGYVGVHAENRKLVGLQKIDLHGEVGPEHVVIGPDGKVYVSVLSRRIVRMAPDGSGQEVFASTGGRPLGMAFDGSGNLIVADAHKGLLSVAANGAMSVLAASVAGDPVRFADAVVVARDGAIYFTDASQRFAPGAHGGTMNAATLDVLEQSATGRVLAYSPASKSVRVVAQGFSFANGIALSADERSLFVNETGRYRVWKIAAAADTADAVDVKQAPPAMASVLLDNLPGYPDNLMRGLDGRIWLGLAGQRDGLDALAERPVLRKVAWRVLQAAPESLVKPKRYGHVMAFTEDGTVVADLQDPSGTSPVVTGATEVAGRLYIHNIDGRELGWVQY